MPESQEIEEYRLASLVASGRLKARGNTESVLRKAEELKKLNLNLTAIDRRGLRNSLLRKGYSQEQIDAITSETQPKFKVSGFSQSEFQKSQQYQTEKERKAVEKENLKRAIQSGAVGSARGGGLIFRRDDGTTVVSYPQSTRQGEGYSVSSSRSTRTTTSKPVGVVSPAQNPKSLVRKGKVFEASQVYLSNIRQTGTQAGKFGAGAGVTVLGTTRVLYEGLENPFSLYTQNVKAIEGGRKIVTKIARGGKFENIGEAIRYEPAFVTGFAVGEYVQGKFPDIYAGISDEVRTVNLKEVYKEDVIAPEYFQGQTYPKIKKGQTAGELLQEFKPLFEGEKKPAGFTASPAPLRSLEIGKSASELPGLYQAPKLSPKFLKVVGETDDLLPTGDSSFLPTRKPTAFRVTPEEVKLLEGVSPSQRRLNPTAKARQSFKDIEPGKSYIPFIKTEKESIIAPGTLLSKKPTRYYFQFEGRKIPIEEYDVTPNIKVSDRVIDIETIGSRSSRNRISNTRAYDLTYVSTRRYSSYSKAVSSLSYTYPKRSFSRSVYSSLSLSKSSSNNYPGSTSPRIDLPRNYGLPSRSSKSYKSYIGYNPYKPVRPTRTPPPTSREPKVFKTRNVLGEYLVEQRRFGKFRPVGKASTAQQAYNIGKDLTLGNLGATFRIRGLTGREKLDIKIDNNIFRAPKSKRERPFTFVQRRGTRLSSYGERSEIQLARRMGL